MDPMTERGRRTRRQIVDAAAALVVERGVEGTGVDAVIAAAGVSKSQLYHYFDDKSALVRAVVEAHTDRIVGGVESQLEVVESWADLRQVFDDLYEFHEAAGCSEGCVIGTLAAELTGRDRSAEADLSAAFERWERAIRSMLDRFIHDGLLHPDADTSQLATATLASIQGGLLLAKTTHDPARLHTVLNAALEQLEHHAAMQRRSRARTPHAP